MVQLSHPYMTTGRTIALTIFFGAQPSLLWSSSHTCTWLLEGPQLWLHEPLSAKWCLCFLILGVGLSQLSFQETCVFQFYGCSHHPQWFWSPRREKSVTVPTFSLSFCHEVMGPDAMTLVSLMLNFKPAFSLSSFTLIKRLFNSSSLSAIRVVSSANLRLLMFLPAIDR